MQSWLNNSQIDQVAGLDEYSAKILGHFNEQTSTPAPRMNQVLSAKYDSIFNKRQHA